MYLNIQRGAFIDWWYIMQFLFLFITILQQCDKILNEKRSDTRELAEQNTKYNRMGSKLFFKKAALKTRLFFFILIPPIQLQVFNACRLGWCGNFLFSLIAVGRCSISLSLFEWGGSNLKFLGFFFYNGDGCIEQLQYPQHVIDLSSFGIDRCTVYNRIPCVISN